MYANFLYFLVALIIYATSDFFQGPSPDAFASFSYTAAASLAFFTICQMAFARVWKRSQTISSENTDYLISKTIQGLSIFSLVVFAFIIYLFRPQSVFKGQLFFEKFPTLQALIFLILFFSFLIMIWNSAWRVHNAVTGTTLGKKQFIFSNASFSLPALLPWLVISLLADILLLIPFTPLQKVLNSPAGEILYVGICLVVIALLGPELIRRLWNCRTLEPGQTRALIEAVCQKAGLTYSDILRWDLFGGTMITAGVMGLIGKFRYILVTPGLFMALDPEELESVMLHEIGHVKRHHMAFYLLFFVMFLICNFLFFEPLMQLVYVAQPVYDLLSAAGISREAAYPVLIAAVLITAFVLYFRFVFGWFMRNFERQADLYVFEFKPNAQALITTFYKIVSISRQSKDKPNWHHFSIAQRIEFLIRCHHEPWMILQHHKRVKRMIAGYLCVAVLLIASGVLLNWGPAKVSYENYIAEKIISSQLDITPESVELYILAGHYFYSREKYQETVGVYENVLKIEPENAEVLNNLSWLYSTCPDTRFRNSEKALEYAIRAANISQKAHVLDTYAEALYVNGDVETALRISRQALAAAEDNHAYFRGQVVRFEKALNADRQK